jgi:hypothetical protein
MGWRKASLHDVVILKPDADYYLSRFPAHRDRQCCRAECSVNRGVELYIERWDRLGAYRRNAYAETNAQ